LNIFAVRVRGDVPGRLGFQFRNSSLAAEQKKESVPAVLA
jgi:hypothetical protein